MTLNSSEMETEGYSEHSTLFLLVLFLLVETQYNVSTQKTIIIQQIYIQNTHTCINLSCQVDPRRDTTIDVR